MGYYDDDGNYHKDAYDYDDLTLKQIMKTNEKIVGEFININENNKEHPPTEQEKNAYEIPAAPAKNSWKSLSEFIGFLIGGVIGLILLKFGFTVLIIFITSFTGRALGELFDILKFQEVSMSFKEIFDFLYKKLKFALVCLLMEIAIHIKSN